MAGSSAWIDATLGDVLVDVQPGFAQRSGAVEGATVAHLRPNNVSPRGWLDLKDIKAVVADPAEIRRCSLEPGDILFNSTNSLVQVGKSALYDDTGPACFSNHVMRLRVDTTVVPTEFVLAWLRFLFLTGHFRRIARQWINQAAITKDALQRVPLSYPVSRHDQVRIASTAGAFREVGRLVDGQTGGAAATVANWFEGRLAASPASTVRLGEIADVTGGLAIGPTRAVQPGLSVPYLRVGNVFRGRVDLSDVRTMKVSQRELETRGLLAGDLLMVETHDPDEVGRVARWEGSFEPCVHQNHLFRIRPHEPSASAYLLLLLNSRIVRAAVLTKVRATAGLHSVRISDMRNLPVPAVRPEMLRVAEEVVTTLDSLERKISGAADLTNAAELEALAFQMGRSALGVAARRDLDARTQPQAASHLPRLWSSMSPIQQQVWRDAEALDGPFRAAEVSTVVDEAGSSWQVDAALDLLAVLGLVGYSDDSDGRLWQIAPVEVE